MQLTKYIITFLLLAGLVSLSAQSISDLTNESSINTEQLEFSPTFYKGGIVFVSSQKPESQTVTKIDENIDQNFMTLYYSERDAEGELNTAEEFSYALSTHYHEGPVSFNRTGNQIFFTRNNYNKGRKVADKAGTIKLNIYTAQRKGEDWGEAEELSFNTSEYEECHPSLSMDGKTLFFSSDREDGFGGMDIYKVEKEDDVWGVPMNLGPNINTAGNDVFPFIHQNGKLYFSSDSRGGTGGLDIFSSIKDQSGSWRMAENIGTPYNSASDDFGFILHKNGRKGYLSSSRDDGFGGDDIYSFQMPEDKATIPAVICTKEQLTNERIPGVLITLLERVKDGSVVSVDDDYVINLVPTNVSGEYTLNVRQKGGNANNLMTDSEGDLNYMMRPNREYVIVATKDGYKTAEQTFSTENMSEADAVNLCLDMIGLKCMSISGVVNSKQDGNRLPNSIVTVTNHCTNETISAMTNVLGEFSFPCMDCSCDFTIGAEKSNYIGASGRISLDTNDCVNGGVKPVMLRLSSMDQPSNSSSLSGNDNYNNGNNTNTDNGYSNGGSGSMDGYGSDRNDAATTTDLVAGTAIELENIYYDFDDYHINFDAARSLDDIVNMMRQYPSMHIELSSHTDSRGTDKYNNRLSRKRAEKAVAYIQSKGIVSDRLIAKGYGEKQLRNECMDGTKCDERKHQYNRRTEVVITKFDRSDIRIRYMNNSPDLVQQEE